MQALPDVPAFYSNAVSVQGGLYDATLYFAERVGAAEPLGWHVRVTMSWEHLRSMVEALQRVIDDYEGQMGPVRDIEGAVREREESSS